LHCKFATDALFVEVGVTNPIKASSKRLEGQVPFSIIAGKMSSHFTVKRNLFFNPYKSDFDVNCKFGDI
jgi:hypothetical protein